MKKDIVCPNCQTTFQVDESVYSAILEQVRTKEFNEELDRRIADIENRHKSREEAIQLKAEKKYEAEIARKKEEIANRDHTISMLNEKMSQAEQETKVKVLEEREACMTEMHEKDKRILELEANIKAEQNASETRELQLKELHKEQLQIKQEEIDRLKDFKLRLSTKMLGETLEQHCNNQFYQAKSLGLFPNATFDKDNKVEEGTKGDFIFRDYVDGAECVSIMFEMKNEADTTATKHKNEHFFEKLDKDRNKKGCEYAVLVSMLEQGNELYDAGIVDVSYHYPRMLVIRPQFFIPVLRLISEGARKGHIQNRELVAELEAARNETRDFSKFEEKINNFAETFGKHVKGAHAKFVSANEGIDKVIKSLESQIEQLRKVKASFEAADKKLLKADDYVGNSLTVRQLTHGAPTVRKMIEDARQE